MSRDPEAEACRALWQSVVMAAVKDAILPEDSHGETALHRQQAREWFRGAGRDYHMVCALSGIDPDMLREAVFEGRIKPEDLTYNTGRSKGPKPEVPAQ